MEDEKMVEAIEEVEEKEAVDALEAVEERESEMQSASQEESEPAQPHRLAKYRVLLPFVLVLILMVIIATSSKGCVADQTSGSGVSYQELYEMLVPPEGK